MSFFKYFEQKLIDQAVPHKLPSIPLNDNFTRIRMRMAHLEGDDSVEAEIKRRIEEPEKEGLVKVSNEIFQYRFFGCFEKSGDQKARGIVIITDSQSQAMMDQAMNWLTRKRYGVSCIFDIKDRVSNSLTKNLQVIYLVNIIYLNDEEFNQQLEDIRRRECLSCLIFLTYIIDPYDHKGTQRVRVLQELISLKGLPPPWVVGAFNAVNPWIAVTGCDPNLEYLRQWINKPKSDQNVPITRIMACRSAFRLVNIFEQMNLFPIIRFMKTWHDHNSTIANLFHRGLTAVQDKRRATGASVDYRRDCILIIIDRTSDLLTPILHATHFQAFVEQELESPFETRGSEFLDEELRAVNIKDIPEKLVAVSRQLKANYANMSIKEKDVAITFARTHLVHATRLMAKIHGGYKQLIELEQQVIERLNRNISIARPSLRKSHKDTVAKNFDEKARPDMCPFDLGRLIMTRSMISSSGYGRDYLKRILGSQRYTYKDSHTVSKYSKLMKTMAEKSETFTIGFPIIQRIIDQVYAGTLSPEKFPFLEESMKEVGTQMKLCIFVLGGLSYNELQFAGLQGARDVMLLSSDLLTAKGLLSALYP